MNYEVKGNLFSAELLENLQEKVGQGASDFGFIKGERLSDEIARVFSMCRNQWYTYQQVIERLDERQSGVSETRKLWMIPFFDFLGYDHLQFEHQEKIAEASFNISHRELSKDGFPVHISGFRQTLDQGKGSGRVNRDAPHVQMQEYLNRTEHLYGIITNGYRIRLLRDHHRLTGIQYVEWDLQQILEANDLASFSILYRMLHISRIPEKQGADSLLENYHQRSVEDGHRVREKLKSAVNESLLILGNGFLKHPQNESLRQLIQSEKLSEVEYGQLLRRLVYRLLFLLVAEDRQLLFKEGIGLEQRKIYNEYYSLNRFRKMAVKHHQVNPRHTDLWEQLKSTFSFFENEYGSVIGLSPMGGDLFQEIALNILKTCKLSNRDFLKMMDLLSHFNPKDGQRIRINYRRISVEEFGAVYEALLDLNPTIDLGCLSTPFAYLTGESRKYTGSYYTHADLVKQLISSTIDPLLKAQRKEAESAHRTIADQKKQRERELLNLKVCDPACGSGHFLLGAARTLGTELAYIRAQEGETIDQYEKQALRDVIDQCIYGVDINPDAVELCRLVLWLEAYVPGKPITYLNHKIKCGNSLVGWQENEENLVIPTGAYKPIQGDDKKIALGFKQRNAKELKGVKELFDLSPMGSPNIKRNVLLNSLPINSQEDLWQKQRMHQAYEESEEVQQQRMIYNAWTYAFFQSYPSEGGSILTQSNLEQIKKGELGIDDPLIQQIQKVAKKLGFFHWNIEFPDVFGRAGDRKGFDVILGNPPWENIMMQRVEFFAERSIEIAKAPNAAERRRLIAGLGQGHPLFIEYLKAKNLTDSQTRFIRESGNFPLCGSGSINTYSIFSELTLGLVSIRGRVGIIVPTGIVTDLGNNKFFNTLISNNQLSSLYDFENQKGLFPEVGKIRFSLLTIQGSANENNFSAQFGFQLNEVNETKRVGKIYNLNRSDINLINPNSSTCPVFKTIIDHQINKKIYERFPVIINESKVKVINPYEVKPTLMFNMSDNTEYLRNKINIDCRSGKTLRTKFIDEQGIEWLRFSEAKFFWHYNHRLSSFDKSSTRKEGSRYLSEGELKLSNQIVEPWYWIEKDRIDQKMNNLLKSDDFINQDQKWFIGFRKITSVINQRTFVSSILPYSAYGDSCPIILLNLSVLNQCIFSATLSSIVFDYLCRQKLSGFNVTLFIFKQLPIIPPEQFTEKDLQFIVPRVLELTYTAWDLKAFADDVWQEADEDLKRIIEERWKYNQNLIAYSQSPMPNWVETQEGEFPFTPFKWDTEYRMTVQSELDAYFAYKYQLEEEELKYILDPELSSLAGEDFPGETFRVLKEKETKKYGEYRTARLVLKSWQEKPWENPLNQRILPTISKPSKRSFRNTDLMHYVMGRIIKHHHSRPKYANRLGRTKMEKLLHGIEVIAEVDLGRAPVKDEYGPADFEFLTQAERNATDLGYFKTIKVGTGNRKDKDKDYRFFYSELENFEELTAHFETEFTINQITQIDELIEIFLPFGSTETEIPITVFAAWNNLLLCGVEITDENQIIQAARDNWHDSKKKYKPEVFQKAIYWLRENKLVPMGKGKLLKDKLEIK